MVMSTAAMADCRKDLRNIGHIEATSAEDAGMSASQIQDMKRAAQILARNGHEDACLEIVAVLSDVQSGDAMKQRGSDQRRAGGGKQSQDGMQRSRSSSDENTQRGSDRRRAGGEGMARAENDDAYRSENPDRVAKAKNAEPVLDAKGNFSVGEMMGADVYSAMSGNKLGEIEDLIMGGEDRQVIIGHGGFLGLGEKNIKISMDDLLVNQNDNSYYVRMSDSKIKTLPGLEKENGRWTQAAADTSSGSVSQNQNRNNENWLTGNDQRQSNSDRGSDRKMENASISKALSEQKGDLSVNRIIGEEVYSSTTGDAIGHVEDMIVGLGGGEHHIVLGHGGFLGMGEKRVKVKLSDLRYNANEEQYSVGLTDETLTSLPGLEKVDGKWSGQAAKTTDNQDRTN